jgi:hypothetical protein
VVATFGLLGTSGVASAAVLNGSVSTTSPANVNLTAEGTIDWAIWDYQVGTTGTTGAPSNKKIGGSAVSSVTALLGTPRGITGTSTPPTYTYADGTSPVAATAAAIGGITDTSINTLGSGFKLNITGNSLLPETVRVYVDVFNAVGTMTATLNGATTYSNSSIGSNATRIGGVYTFTFQPNVSTDTLQLNYSISTLNTGGSSNVSLQAASVGVPEPASLGLVGAAGMLLLRRRRARRV